MSALEVVDPGLGVTIQDLGRPGHGHLGIPAGGAADRWSLRVANALLGNRPGAAGLEVTGGLAVLRASVAMVVAVAGADLGATVGGTRVLPGSTVRLPAGASLSFAGAAPGAHPRGLAGLRAYVAVPGGIDVEPVLGSRSTLASAGLGGFGGRAVVAGDRLAARLAGPAEAAGRRWPSDLAPPPGAAAGPVAFVPGPDTSRSPSAVAALAAATWRVLPESDRVGLRLAGPSLRGGDGAGHSFGVLPGFIQLPPGGGPIVLLADHQTVGGYPVIGVVASADLPRIGQARPGDSLSFTRISVREAHRRLRAQEDAFAQAEAALTASVRWDAQHLDAGG